MEQFKIGAFSKNIGVSVDLINYYEDLGVIQPIAVDENRYRNYAFNQTRIIYEAEKYRNLGFSIKEAAQLINEADKEKLHEAFVERKKALEEKLYIIQKQIDFIKHIEEEFEKQSTYEMIQSTPYYFIEHAVEHTFSKNEDIICWKNYLPLAQQATLVQFDPSYPEDIDHVYFVHGFICEEEIVHHLNLPMNENIQYFPSKKVMKYSIVTLNEYPQENLLDAIRKTLPLHIDYTAPIITIFDGFFIQDGKHVKKYTFLFSIVD